jgi:hypothetical protein
MSEDSPKILETIDDGDSDVKKVNIESPSKTLANVLAEKNKSKTKTNLSMNMNMNRTKKNLNKSVKSVGSVGSVGSIGIPKTANEVVAKTAGIEDLPETSETSDSTEPVGDETTEPVGDETTEPVGDEPTEPYGDEPVGDVGEESVMNKSSRKESDEESNESPATLVQTTSEDVSEKKNKNVNKKQVDSLNQLAINMFNHYIAMKLYHFQTENYSAHKTSDGYIEKFLELKDRFLEVAQGIYGKINLKKYDIKGSSHNDENIFNHINGYIKYLNTSINEVLGDRTDLINIRDEMLSEANQLKYLLTFT